MPTLTIDNKKITVPPGTTILQAAAQLGITIPALCHYPGIEPPTSCFLCIVKINQTPGLVPSCVAQAEDKMDVKTNTKEIRDLRRQALELLLSDHTGDCEAPCTKTCPAHLDIPQMLLSMLFRGVAPTTEMIKQFMPFPGILGYICPAPCEKGCRRKILDTPLPIRDLHRHCAETFHNQKLMSSLPETKQTKKQVAIVGAGPAGLASAFFLAQHGHQCAIYDKNQLPGGMLVYGIDQNRFPRNLLEKEIESIKQLGIKLIMQTEIGKNISLNALENEYDAIILAPGQLSQSNPVQFEIATVKNRICINPKTYETGCKGIFACGAAIRPNKMVARSIGQARATAAYVHYYLTEDHSFLNHVHAYNSRINKINKEEIEHLRDTSPITESSSQTSPYSHEYLYQARRCLVCDCQKKVVCDLRKYAQEYEVKPRSNKISFRRPLIRHMYNKSLISEPGKCIKCGRCVGITSADQMKPGLTFLGKGFDLKVDAPFAEDLDKAMEKSQTQCVKACPTGALTAIPKELT